MKKEERPYIRKVVEQPYQETLSERWTEVAEKILASFPFLMAKAKADMVEGILEDYAFLWNKASDYLKSQLDLWRSFFSERVHILRRGNTEWPAYKMLLQLAIEHADDSPLTIAAEKWLAEGHCDWLWLRRVPRLPHAQKNPCLAVLEGHTADVNGALVLSDGRLLSWSGDETLRLWDRHSGACLAVFQGHTDRFMARWSCPTGVCFLGHRIIPCGYGMVTAVCVWRCSKGTQINQWCAGVVRQEDAIVVLG